MIDTLTVEQAAAVCECHPCTIRTRIKSGEIPARKVGRRYVILKDRLHAYLAGETMPPCSTAEAKPGTADLRPKASALISPAALLAERKRSGLRQS